MSAAVSTFPVPSEDRPKPWLMPKSYYVGTESFYTGDYVENVPDFVMFLDRVAPAAIVAHATTCDELSRALFEPMIKGAVGLRIFGRSCMSLVTWRTRGAPHEDHMYRTWLSLMFVRCYLAFIRQVTPHESVVDQPWYYTFVTIVRHRLRQVPTWSAGRTLRDWHKADLWSNRARIRAQRVAQARLRERLLEHGFVN